MNGYLSKSYADAFKSYGEPIYLRASRGYILKKPIEGSKYSKLEHLFPFFSCQKPLSPTTLTEDLEHFKSTDISSITLLTDPLMQVERYLNTFKLYFDKVEKADTYYIINFSKELQFAHNHWDNIRTFAKYGGEITNCTLYNTVNRVEYAKLFYEMTSGTFPQDSIIQMFNSPGIVVFKAEIEEQPVAMVVFYIQENNAYYHLIRNPIEGQIVNASYALMYEAINFFKQLGMNFLLIGNDGDTSPNLGITASKFRGTETWNSGWANDQKDSYLLHAVLNAKGYKDEQMGKREVYS